MSWSDWMAKEYFLADKEKIRRNKTGRNILCAFRPNGCYQIEEYAMESHICCVQTLSIGETLENENVIFTITGAPGPTTGWEHKIYCAEVQIKEGKTIEIEWL